MKTIVACSLLACVSVIATYISDANAYPGMQKQNAQQVQSTIDLINVLPQSYPIVPVPFTDHNGKSVDFSQYKGKVVMVNMWATWCPPCVRELPALERFAQKLNKDEFVILPISIDAEGQQQVNPFLKDLGLETFTSYYDPQQNLREVFPLDTIPATFILNKEGQLVAFVRTYVDWDDAKAVGFIEGLIQKSQVK